MSSTDKMAVLLAKFDDHEPRPQLKKLSCKVDFYNFLMTSSIVSLKFLHVTQKTALAAFSCVIKNCIILHYT